MNEASCQLRLRNFDLVKRTRKNIQLLKLFNKRPEQKNLIEEKEAMIKSVEQKY